jgi:hypothetical protein
VSPVNSDDYKYFADTELNEVDMEAVAANAEQEYDMNQVIRHNVYIGWVLALAKGAGVSIEYHGGNRFNLIELPNIVFVIPYPPTEWEPK